MATPVGHSLIGIAFGRLATATYPVAGSAWRWYALFLLAANAPDFDFIPGMLVGDPNRYHQGFTHSFIAVIMFGAIAAGLARFLPAPAWSAGLAGAFAYGSHLLLDLFCHDNRAPFGIPLLWPFSDEPFRVAWTVFPGVAHGVSGDGLAVVLAKIFSPRNFAAVGIEVIVLLPIFLICWCLTRKRWRTNPDSEIVKESSR